MLILKKLFSPEVHDICPNCGQACATTDVLCPKCGKNLDELFDQAFDPANSSLVAPKWRSFPISVKASRIWRVLNSLALIITLVVPWEAVYSDVLPSKPLMIIGLNELLISIPDVLPYIFQFDCLSCISMGLIAIGHLSLMLYAVLNFGCAILNTESRYHSLQGALRFCVITSCLVFLQIVTRMFQAEPTWGYWLACIGLLSSLLLEATELISRKSFVNSSFPEAA
jgi:hypothetical protein